MDKRDTEWFTRALKALAEPKRRQILREVATRSEPGEHGVTCTCILAEMGIAQSTLSHHVEELVKAGLLKCAPDGKYMRLEVDRKALDEVSVLLKSFVEQEE